MLVYSCSSLCVIIYDKMSLIWYCCVFLFFNLLHMGDEGVNVVSALARHIPERYNVREAGDFCVDLAVFRTFIEYIDSQRHWLAGSHRCQEAIEMEQLLS